MVKSFVALKIMKIKTQPLVELLEEVARRNISLSVLSLNGGIESAKKFFC